jgi:hypothetical protein
VKRYLILESPPDDPGYTVRAIRNTPCEVKQFLYNCRNSCLVLEVNDVTPIYKMDDSALEKSANRRTEEYVPPHPTAYVGADKIAPGDPRNS